MLLTLRTPDRPLEGFGLGAPLGAIREAPLGDGGGRWGTVRWLAPAEDTIAILVETDPLALAGAARRPKGAPPPRRAFDGALLHAASPLLAIGIAKVLEATSPAEPATGFALRLPTLPRAEDAAALFAPLGHALETAPPDGSGIFDATLRGEAPLGALLAQVAAVLVALDEGPDLAPLDAVAGRLRPEPGWLADHPARDRILSRLAAPLAPPAVPTPPDAPAWRRPRRLDAPTRGATVAALEARGARRVLALDADPALIGALAASSRVDAVGAADASVGGPARLHEALAALDEATRSKVTVLAATARYRDARLEGWDTVLLPPDLADAPLARREGALAVLLGELRPALAALAPAGASAPWAEEAAARRGYAVEPLGPALLLFVREGSR